MSLDYDTKIVLPNTDNLTPVSADAYPYLEVGTEAPFWTRLWNLISNPVRYLFTGKVRL